MRIIVAVRGISKFSKALLYNFEILQSFLETLKN